MTTLIYIGGTAATDESPCHSLEQWHSLYDALARGDHDEVMRIALVERPTMLPTASLQPQAAEDAATHAETFWQQYAERNGAAKPAKRGQTQYDVAPNRADPETNEVLRRITEGGKS